MEKIHIHASKSYDVIIGSGLLQNIPILFPEELKPEKAAIVSDNNIWPIYGEKVAASLSRSGIQTCRFIFSSGEGGKSMETYTRLLEFLAVNGLTRKDALFALGGGVTGDVAGFAAATWLRGISLVQIPTSLLAAVDSSVGGKTAINLAKAKNQVGCFHQPDLVVCDTDTLHTLPEREFISGCAEVIKYTMLGNEKLLHLVKDSVQKHSEAVIAECVKQKKQAVESDEYDRGARIMLNLGHTFGHAAEAMSEYSITHGEGVAMGMSVITRAACSFGICSGSVYDMLSNLLKQYHLPERIPFSAYDIAECCRRDKKSSGSSIKLIVPVGIGQCSARDIPVDKLTEWLNAADAYERR